VGLVVVAGIKFTVIFFDAFAKSKFDKFNKYMIAGAVAD
jgi:hypothetical protein